MKRFVVACTILMLTLGLNAQQLNISDSAKISLITCSPGPELYAQFGHTAIRVNDPVNHFDIVFNYGIFSFNTSHFYYKFIKGETDYQLGIYDTSLFLPEYKERNSAVWEQQLNLNRAEKRTLFNLLMENYRPENRVYRYNFVFDNCATRPRDKILSALDGYVRFRNYYDAKTFRQWIGVYTGNDSWTKFGIDLLFGMDADKNTTLSESMFLPEVLMNEFQQAQIVNDSNQTHKLVLEKVQLVSKNEPTAIMTSGWMEKPLTVTIAILVAGIFITLWDVNRHRHFKALDSVLWIITGLTGLLLCFMMLVSTHPLVKNNLNILWLNPLNILTGIVIWIRNIQVRKIVFFYQIVNMLFLVLALVCFALSLQAFNIATFPLIVLLLIRASRWFAYTKHRLYKTKDIR